MRFSQYGLSALIPDEMIEDAHAMGFDLIRLVQRAAAKMSNAGQISGRPARLGIKIINEICHEDRCVFEVHITRLDGND